MKLQNLYTVAALAAMALPAFSRPATPEVLTHVNPDGTTVEYRLIGNEHFSYMTTVDGSQLLELNGTTLAPMLRNGSLMKVTDANIQLLRSEQPEEPEIAPVNPKKGARMAALNGNGQTTYPTIGNARACVILLEYADTPFISKDPVDQFNRLCNEKGYSDYTSRGSAKDYFEACSSGKYSPQFDVYGPVKLKHPASYYVADPERPKLLGTGSNARFGEAIKEAFEALDDEVDFSIYDYDNDNNIDNIFFFYSGYGQADTGDKTRVWPHQADFHRYTSYYTSVTGQYEVLGLEPIIADGKEMRTYACSCELNGSNKVPANLRPMIDGIGAFCHEYGHVLGLPDFYDTLTSTTGVKTKTPGYYTVMDSGSYNDLSTCPPLMSAYERWVCNWLDFEELTQDSKDLDITLNPQMSPDANAVRIRVARPGTAGRYYQEYYILEARDKTGWDTFLPQHGMLIWRIDYNANIWQNNAVNTNGEPHIELMGTGKSTNIAWPGETEVVNHISPANSPFYCSYNKKIQDITITDIAFDYETKTGPVTFTFNKYQSNDLTTVLGATPLADHDNLTLTLQWQAVPEASDYQLTVKRRNSSGREFTVGALDELSVGNVTSYQISNLTDVQWGQTFTAYVRVVTNLPSSKTSNVITFIPAELENSGVDGIDADSILIYGGKGEIIAPAGARAFNLSGVETGLTDLPAGIYIVVANGATAKVMVK